WGGERGGEGWRGGGGRGGGGGGRADTSPSRAKRKAMTVVAKTSKKPSTQRGTTHQRQYSTMLMCVWRRYMRRGPENSAMVPADRANIRTSGRRSLLSASAGQMTRSMRTSQMRSPRNRPACQTRPRSRYSQP